ncbi:MAG: 2Fe-2S iron-sulfur cluster-binding protein [Alphaproteobacteria bacterium]
MTTISMTVNGRRVEADVEPRTSLADFLREHLLLTGTHIGCEHGICGACTVEIDGAIARSCINYAVQCDGAAIRTIEDFDDDPLMARLRQAFTEHHALQCGYCTPGMLIAARDLIRRTDRAPELDIRIGMSGNLCRCTGYTGIIRAIAETMEAMSPGERGAVEGRGWLGPVPGPGTGGVTAEPRGEAVVPRPAQVAMSSAVSSESSAVPFDRLEEEGLTTLTQSLVIAQPLAKVWEVLSNLETVARCLPGARMTSPVRDGRFAGAMAVGLGPITTDFAGAGIVRIEKDAHRVTVEGRGQDSKSATRARGRIAYVLSDRGPAATAVDVTIAYGIAGPLAQFGRPAMVRALIERLTEVFVANIERYVRDPASVAETARLSGLALFWSMVAGRIRSLFRRGR